MKSVSQNSNTDEIVEEFNLFDPYPNPFNPVTNISFSLPDAGLVTIKVYDILGNETATLLNENLESGHYNVPFDVGTLSTGIYIIKLRTAHNIAIKKLIYMK